MNFDIKCKKKHRNVEHYFFILAQWWDDTNMFNEIIHK